MIAAMRCTSANDIVSFTAGKIYPVEEIAEHDALLCLEAWRWVKVISDSGSKKFIDRQGDGSYRHDGGGATFELTIG